MVSQKLLITDLIRKISFAWISISVAWPDSPETVQVIESTAVRIVEAGGVEPPSEKRYGPKPTCLSHSIWFAGCAWNAQDALPTSPINLAGKPRTEVRRPAYCVTPRSKPVGEAWGNGLR